MVRSPAGKLEQLLDRPPVHGLSLVGLVRPACPDCRLDIHGGTVPVEQEA
jgi:hypothetical protein